MGHGSSKDGVAYLMEHRDEIPTYLNRWGLTGTGVEVGVSQGEYSDVLLSKWSGKKLYLVDAWRHFDGVEDISNPPPATHFRHMLMTLQKVYAYGSRATIIRDLSANAANLFQDGTLDFVYIDASHDYENVKIDLQTWYPKVKPGGVFAGHDYLDGTIHFNDGEGKYAGAAHYGVKRAVDEFAVFHRLKIDHTNPANELTPSWYTMKGGDI